MISDDSTIARMKFLLSMAGGFHFSSVRVSPLPLAACNFVSADIMSFCRASKERFSDATRPIRT